MSVRFDAAADYLIRSADLPSADAMTACGWAYRSTDTNDYAAIFAFESADVNDGYTLLEFGSTGDTVDLWIDIDGGSQSDVAFFAPTNPGWFFWALVISNSGLSVTAYCANLGDTSLTASSTLTESAQTFPPDATMQLGNDSFGEDFNGRVCGVKIWSGASLSTAELWQEMQTFRPHRFANLHMWTPLLLHTDVVDYSGNGRNWTTNGTLTTEAQAPISWGAQPSIMGKTAAAAAAALGGAYYQQLYRNLVVT